MRTPPTLLVLALALTACGSDVSTRIDGPTPAAPTTTAAAARPVTAPSPTPVPPTPVTPARRGGVVPDGFPLTDGYPADDDAEPGRRYGLDGPHRSGPPLEITACDRTVALPEHTDLLQAGWSNIADDRRRQVVTFTGERQATAYLADVVAAFRTCAERTDRSGVAGALHTVVTTGLGDQSAAVSTHYRSPEGYPTTLLGTLHVVRVGGAVLLATTTNEGGAGPDPEGDAADQVAQDADAIAGVIRAMRGL
jgi:hypothetical protein